MMHPGDYEYKPDKHNALLNVTATKGWAGEKAVAEFWTPSGAVVLPFKEAKKLHKQLGKLIKYVENKEAE